MCMIIFDNRPTTEQVDKGVFERALSKNDDGMGIMYAVDGMVRHWEDMKDFEGLWSRYLYARQKAIPCAVHFRKGTHGTNNIDNTHPFMVNDNLGFMHNGTMGWASSAAPKGCSDTRWLCEKVLPHFPSNFLDEWPMRETLVELAGGDRMLFVNEKNEYTIINEKRGFWDNKVWYSHGRYKTWMLSGQGSSAEWYYSDYRESNWPVGGFVVAKDKGKKVQNNTKPLIGSSVTQISKANSLKARSQSMLLFDYGFVTQEDRDIFGMKYLGGAILDDHELWAVEDDKNTPIEEFIPAMFTQKDSATQGSLFRIEEQAMFGLNEVREYFAHQLECDAGAFRQIQLPVKPLKIGATRVQALTYIATTGNHNLVTEVHNGDWDEFRRALGIMDEPVLDDAINGTLCPKCDSSDTSSWTDEKANEEFLFCNGCLEVTGEFEVFDDEDSVTGGNHVLN